MQKLVIFIPVTDQVKEKCCLFPQMDFEMTAFIFAYFHRGSNFQSAVWSVCVSVYVCVCVCVCGHCSQMAALNIKCLSVWLYSC